MCTHGRYIFNRYSRKRVFVKCGHCEACLQEKASARARRIRNNVTDGTLVLFITLTYANDYVPFIYRSDLVGYGDLNVYRSADIRFVYDRHSDKLRYRKDNGIHPIACVDQFDIDTFDTDCYRSLSGMSKDKIGVCWYPDIQEFFKRLRQILLRNYSYDGYFSYYSCSELGSHTQRPHFHALLFIERDAEAIFRSAICKAWPYADKARTAKYIECARDAANYVASYVNCHSDLLPLLQSSFFKPKHSASKNFGVVLDCFSLRSVLQKIDSGDLFYYRSQRFDGKTSVCRMPIPLYVLHRYFPVCKGFSWLSPCQLRAILLYPAKIGDFLSSHSIRLLYKRDIFDYSSYSRCFEHCLSIAHTIVVNKQTRLDNPVYSYSPHETYQLYVRLENAYQRFHFETGLSRYDYAFYFERVYSLYSSMILRLSHEDITCVDEYSDFYENALDVFYKPGIAPTLDLDLQLDPNKRKDIVYKTDVFSRLYYLLDKQKSVTNYCMSHCGHYV